MASETTQFTQELIETARKITAPGKGILAADESTGTIGSRFSNINVENTFENRQTYRHLLFSSTGLGQYISGVIQFEEALEYKDPEGRSLQELLQAEGIVPGIKVDKGVVLIPGTAGETATQGLDGLGERCKKYYHQGCRFAKWRAVLKIGPGMPTERATQENAWTLARYAVICQENGLVPIIEPEILADGAHSIAECAEKTQKVLSTVVKACHDQGLLWEGALLKPNMVTSGSSADPKASPGDVAWRTVQTLNRTVPAALPGIMFLSGGQSEEEASTELNAINAIPGVKRPWALSFSFGRALQASCLCAWGGQANNIKAAQEVLLLRCKANSEAALGTYQGGAGGEGAQQSLFVSNYTY